MLNAEECRVGSCKLGGADWMLLWIEWEERYFWVRGIGIMMTAGECIVGSCMVNGAEWRLLGNLMGREILVGERIWETFDCRRVHSGELHAVWC